MKIITLIVVLIFVAIGLLCIAWLLAEFKARAFRKECIYLDNLIKRSDVTVEAYEDINGVFNELDPISEADRKRKKSLWLRFQYKFKELSPYKL